MCNCRASFGSHVILAWKYGQLLYKHCLTLLSFYQHTECKFYCVFSLYKPNISYCLHVVIDLWNFTTQGGWVSMAVTSDGNTYGIPEGLIFSFPVVIGADKTWEVVNGLEINDFAREKLEVTAKVGTI